MCGRLSTTANWRELQEYFGLLGPPFDPGLRYNVAPTQDVPVVRPSGDWQGGRILSMLRWGLVPHWTKDPSTVGARLINARAETVAAKPPFRDAFRHRRCLIAASGFYEWRGGTGGLKQPYRVALKGLGPMALAGLWERWDKSPDGRPLDTCAIITTQANELLSPIHDRMPVIVARADFAPWLDTDSVDSGRAVAFLGPYPSQAMIAYPVSRRVNNPRNDDVGCIEPVGSGEEL